MPRYYFHVRRHDVFEEDPMGLEFPSLDVAHNEAVLAAREMISEKVLTDEVIDAQSFEITAEDGDVLDTVPFRSVLRFE
ncbi:hypothetical protein ASC71_00450 [Rhizobium sp. Root1240]|uniref:DUF6894 family protein n=1 Tax=Rhizobium sp. Root274 TaxID=1736507 RepID=UPI0007134EDA|nr:hypothetical protein ASC71_00450 [Rhizobium sp. Root1240]